MRLKTTGLSLVTFCLLPCLLLVVRRNREQRRLYDELSESHAGLWRYVLELQRQQATRWQGREYGYGAIRARNIAATGAPRVEFSQS